ncbi:MAG: segregation/condensation protein A [Lachnospiraceae bacterium]|jgi:segregation and condensation protein A|nr:segregation/condensation protein A [Lachnospiraceae bacterium]
MNNLLLLETNQYAIKLDNFEGPLDLLCHLIDKNQMDVYDIKISEIADQYIKYINELESYNLEIASEFLVMASMLIYLKSKTLLPKEIEDEAELTEEELLQKILEYKQYKEVTKKLRDMYEIHSKRAYKLPEKIELPKQSLETQYSKEIVIDLYSSLVNKNKEKMNVNKDNIKKIAISESVTVVSKVKDIFRELFRKNKFVFGKLFKVTKSNKVEVVTAFSGLLELTRRNKVKANQEELFGDILVEKAKRNK